MNDLMTATSNTVTSDTVRVPVMDGTTERLTSEQPKERAENARKTHARVLVDKQEVMTVIEKIGMPAMLEQLAEECAELAQAALKLARIKRGENPTPVKEAVAIENLIEEIADVQLCITEIIDEDDRYRCKIGRYKEAKTERWHKRLEKVE